MTNILISLVCILLVSCLVISYNFYKSNKNFIKLFNDYVLLEAYANKIEELSMHSEENTHKENFIKFISDSRELAFEYIEEVQLGLTKYFNEIEPEIEYFKKFGELTSNYPNYDSMKKITEAYDELKKLLPVEEKQ